MAFRFTGFADEAEKSLGGQIDTLKEVGWGAIELRLIDGANVCDFDDDQWKHAWDKLREAGIQVVGFGGQIANWARPIDSDFEADLAELRRVAPRMREAGAPYLRIMSYPNSSDSPLSRDEWGRETVRRIRELATIAEGEGIILGHENCSGYGKTPEGYLEIVEAVNSPALKLIFDTGNNSLHANDLEDTWNYYKACRNEIAHVHIKCAKPGPEGGEFVACHVDEDPLQRKILQDLEDTGYDGWLSIEPHIMAAIHAGKDVDDSGQARAVWVDYAKRLEALVADIDPA